MEWWTLNLPATTGGSGDSKVTVLNGIRLSRNKDGRFVVVAKDRKAEETDHAVRDVMLGMEILKINNKETPFITLLDEDDHPTKSTSSKISGLEPLPNTKLLTLVVRPPTASVDGFIVTPIYKPKVDTRVGIAFWQSDPEVDTGHVLIDKMVKSPCKSVAAPNIKPGMRLISINNKLCYNCKEAADTVRNTSGLLTLLVQTPNATTRPLYDPVVATFPLFVFESEQNQNATDLGLHLEVMDGKIIISELTKVFSSIKNDLREGMELISINNVKVHTPDMAHALLMGAVACAIKNDNSEEAKQRNVVTILAQHMMEPPPGTLVTASVIKPSVMQNGQATKLGLIQGMQMPQSLDRLPKDYENVGHVVIRRISEGGLIAQTAEQNTSGYRLQPGMILHQVTIMGKTTSLKGMHNKQVSELLRTAGRGCTVSFLAEVPPSASASGANSKQLYPKTSIPSHIFSKLDIIAITKTQQNQSIGMTLAKDNGGTGAGGAGGGPQIMVIQVEENGLAAFAGIKVGMQIVTVNNTYVKTVLDVVTMIKNSTVGVPVSLLVMRDAASFIPPVVTGTVYKETKGSKVGIKLRKYKGGSAIVNIKEDSISSHTDLLGGLLIQSINNTQGEKISDTEQAANLLIEGQGDITMLAVTPEYGLRESSPFVTATVVLTPETSLQEDAFTYQDGKVWISESGMKGMFEGTTLRVGMEVVTINNIDCCLLAKPEGIMSLMETGGNSEERRVATILAKRAILPPPKQLVTATVIKESCESKIGLTYVVDNTNKKTVLTRIDDGSLAATTKVLPGMEILTINNSPVQGLDREGVAKLFAEASGVVNYVGVTHEPQTWVPDDRMLICANLDKTPTSDNDNNNGSTTPVGIKVIRDHYDRIVVCHIEEGSLAASSDLIPGLVLLSINNHQLKGKTALDVVALLQRARGMVTILAEASPFGKLVTGTLVKDSPETKLGVTMIQRKGRVLIKKFVPNSLCEASDLDIGMWIKSINNRDITRASVVYAARLLGRENPVVTVLAETTTETFEEEEEQQQANTTTTKEEEEKAENEETKENDNEEEEGQDNKEGEAAAEKKDEETEDDEEAETPPPEDAEDNED